MPAQPASAAKEKSARLGGSCRGLAGRQRQPRGLRLRQLPLGLLTLQGAERPIQVQHRRVLAMQGRMQGPVEVGPVRSLEQHRQVAAVLPVVLPAHSGGDPGMKGRAGQGIADRDPDRVGSEPAHQIGAGLDVGPDLAGIAQLQEEGHTNAMAAQPLDRGRKLGRPIALLHGIQDPLGAALDPQP